MFTCCGLTSFCDCICRGQDFLLDNVNTEGNRCHRGVLYDVVYLWGRGLHHLQRLMLIAQVLLPGQLRGGVPDMPHPLPPQPHWVGVIARVGGRAQATAEELQNNYLPSNNSHLLCTFALTNINSMNIRIVFASAACSLDILTQLSQIRGWCVMSKQLLDNLIV